MLVDTNRIVEYDAESVKSPSEIPGKMYPVDSDYINDYRSLSH